MADFLATPLFTWTGGYLVGLTVGSLVAAVFANAVSLSIFDAGHGEPSADGNWLYGTTTQRRSGLIGLAGGIGSAVIVLGIPLLSGTGAYR